MTLTSGSTMKPDIQFLPDKSSDSDAADLELVEVGRDGVNFLLLTGRLKAISFERFTFPFCSSDSVWNQRISEVLSAVDEARPTQLPRQFLVNDNTVSIVPKVVFDESKADSLYSFINQPTNSKLMHQPMSNSDSVGIFTVPEFILSAAGNQVRSSKLQWVDSLVKPNARHQAHLHLGTSEFSLTVIEPSGRMVFYNHFPFRSAEDVLYFTSATFESIKLLHTELQISLYGIVEKGDAVFSLLSKYFARMNFGSLPTTLEYAYSFQELEGHRFPEIFVSACA